MAIALIRIPRLFFTHLFFPLAISFAIVGLQIFLSSMALTVMTRRSTDLKTSQTDQTVFARRILFGSDQPSPTPRICRWVERPGPDGKMTEYPPDTACTPDRLDVAIQVGSPDTFNPAQFLPIVSGNAARLHLCKSCEPDVVIHQNGTQPSTDMHSIWGVILSTLFYKNSNVTNSVVETAQFSEAVTALIGPRSLFIPGLRMPVSGQGFKALLMIVLNIALIVITALWLMLRAHRRLLDYFARNGALLPMVAASGTQVFYGALWMITLARVGAFLLASIPFTITAIDEVMGANSTRIPISEDLSAALLWFIAIICSMALASLVASMSDLKSRHHWLSFCYRYVPLLAAVFGALFWAITILFESELAVHLRHTIAALPVFGMTAMLMAPIFKPPFLVMVFHALTSLTALVLILRHNSRWFAAHLEEL